MSVLTDPGAPENLRRLTEEHIRMKRIPLIVGQRLTRDWT